MAPGGSQETGPATASDITLDPGQPVEVRGAGYAPNQDLTVTFFSEPVSLGAVRSDTSGAYRAAVTIPLGAEPGSHSIVVAGQSANGGSRRTTAAVTVNDVDCSNFRFREDAQAVYDANRTDPHRLDSDRNGKACETLARRSTGGLPRTGGQVGMFGAWALCALALGWAIKSIANHGNARPAGQHYR